MKFKQKPRASSWVEPTEDVENAALRGAPPHRCLIVLGVCCLLGLELASAIIQNQHRPDDAARPGVVHDASGALGTPEAVDAPGLRRTAAAADSSSSSCGSSAGDHTSKAFEPVVFFIMVYLLSAFAQQLEMISPASFRVPHSVVLFLSGLALGRIGDWAPDSEFGRTVAAFMHVDPHIIFWVLLPALLYEDASGVKWAVMKKVLPSALLLAVPGVIVNALLTGAIIKGVFGTIYWTWDAAFLLGVILSATDPVAVVGALHELAAPDRLSLLISGESLFNDGSAVVIFGLFWDSARGVRQLSPGYSIAYFIRLACGGPLLGLLFAIVAFMWLKHTRKFSIEILVIVVTVYGSFFVAEHSEVKVSGVLAVVIIGFFMAARGHFALNVEENDRHHAVIRFLALLSNEAIFVLAGVVSFRVLFKGTATVQVQDWFELVILYFVIHGTRALILLLGFPLLRRWGYGCSVKEALICLFGGLRGAVGLALALMVEHDPRLDEATRARIAFHTSGIVLATLLINGTLITSFYKKLQVYQEAQHHAKLLRMALIKADSLTSSRGLMFEQHWFFHNCHFTELFEAVPNLVQASEELEQWRKGGHSHGKHVEKVNVNGVMTKIANRLGTLNEQGLIDRYMQKVRFRRRWARSHQNVFMSASMHDAADDLQSQFIVNELTMRMANLDMKQDAYASEAASEEGALDGNADGGVGAAPSRRNGDEDSSTVPSLPIASPLTPTKSSLRHAQAGAATKPIIAWSKHDPPEAENVRSDSEEDSSEAGEHPVVAQQSLQSRVHFADTAERLEIGTMESSVRGSRNPSLASNIDRNLSSAVITALPSTLPEKDQRFLYMQLVEGARSKLSKFVEDVPRRKRQEAAHELSVKAEPSTGSKASSSGSRFPPGRANLQALRVEALFRDFGFKHAGEVMSMALAERDLTAAKERNDRRAQAQARWKIAKAKVFWALRKIQSALTEHQKLLEGAEKGARLAKARSYCSSIIQIQDDSASMVEMHHTILNATRAAYKEMYEAHSLPEGPFRVLMQSLELQEEAIDGELQHAVCAPSDPELDSRLANLPSASHQEQMELSFVVSWMYVAERKNRAWDKSGTFDCMRQERFLLLHWWHVVADVTLMLAFIMTAESIVEELEVIQDFEEQVKKPMLQVTERARAAALYKLMMKDPAMFYLFEHVLCLRLMLDFQTRLVMDLAAEGRLPEEDADDMIHRVIQPVVIELDRYVPTREQLRNAGRQWQCSGTGGRSMKGMGGMCRANSMRVAPELVMEEMEPTETTVVPINPGDPAIAG